MMFFALSCFRVFEGSTIAAGKYLATSVQTSANKLLVNLKITEPSKGKLEILALPYSKKEHVFQGSIKCKTNASILDLNLDAYPHRKLIKFSDSLASDDEHTHHINLEEQGLWLFVLSNCGSDPVTFTGNSTLNSENGHMDERYVHYEFVSFAEAVVSCAFLVIFYIRSIRGKPLTVSLTRSQKLVLVIACLMAANGIENVILFELLNRTGLRLSLLLNINVITKTLYQVCALYTASQILISWRNVPFWPFSAALVSLLVANSLDQDRATSISYHVGVRWGLGFHPIVRFWLIYYLLHGVTLSFALRVPKSEDEITDEEAEKLLKFQNSLEYLWSSGVISGILITIFVLAKVLSNCEWLFYALEPIYFTAFLLIEARFCQTASAAGWMSLASASTGNIPTIKEADCPLELSDGGIPALISSSFSSDSGEEITKAD